MSEPRALSVRCRAPEAVRRRFYRSLAHALAATAPPCGALFEATWAEPVPWVTVRPESLVATVRASPGFRWVSLDRRAEPPPLEPPAGWGSRIRTVVPANGFPTPPCTVDAGREPPELEPLLGPRGWLGTQTAWLRGPGERVAVARRVRFATDVAGELEARAEAVGTAVAESWALATGRPAVTVPATRSALRDWRRGTLAAVPAFAWSLRPPEGLERTAELLSAADLERPGAGESHVVVFGSSGAGKTTYLAREAARHAERGQGVAVLDLHGDLAPAVLGRLTPRTRARAVAVDAGERPVAGIAALGTAPGAEDRTAAHLVAALKRLSPDGTDLHWGFRLERLFDSFVRLVQESGGSLVDLYALLTEPDRRDAARLATRRPDLARFLDELGPILKRQPDFLWSAATRLSKVVLVEALTELLAPADGGLPVETLLLAGRPLLVRIPFALLGPEAAAFAGTLLLARLYLGLAARRGLESDERRVLLVLDEAHAFAPRLVAELLTESRKFGLRVLLATQYPERLPLEPRLAAAGAPGVVATFRVPRRSARTVGEWVGIGPEEAERSLPELPVGHGVYLDPDHGALRALVPDPPAQPVSMEAWRQATAATRREFAVAERPESAPDPEPAVERLLLAALAFQEEGRAFLVTQAVPTALHLPGAPLAPEEVQSALARALREGYLSEAGGLLGLTAAGERRIGLGRPTGASRESVEHRALIVATFRLFARRGYRLEVLRQGRYDTTLPDARFRQLPEGLARLPRELAPAVDRARTGWAWRCFGGRDVHVEAEVSGALRPERIRHGYRKAAGVGAFALFVVGDAARARKVRSVLRELGAGPDRAQVWTLRLPEGLSAASRPSNAK